MTSKLWSPQSKGKMQFLRICSPADPEEVRFECGTSRHQIIHPIMPGFRRKIQPLSLLKELKLLFLWKQMMKEMKQMERNAGILQYKVLIIQSLNYPKSYFIERVRINSGERIIEQSLVE